MQIKPIFRRKVLHFNSLVLKVRAIETQKWLIKVKRIHGKREFYKYLVNES